MARPRKNNAEYFSHDANLRNDIKLKALRSKYKSDGYAAFCILLEILTDADNFRVANSPLQTVLISGDIGIDDKLYTDILDFMVSIDLMQRSPEWIWNDHLLERMQPVLNKRKFMQELYAGGQKAPETPPTPPPVSPEGKAPKKPPREKRYLTQEQWKEFIALYPKADSVYKAKEKFLKLESTYTHTISGETRDTWSDILTGIGKWKKSASWTRGYQHNATTWINGHMWEAEPEPYDPAKYNKTKQPNNVKATKQSGYSDHKV